jgi:predicted signal transduction protein with EAL and GGDEF domain
MLLKTVADRLKITTRESDLIARLGGDEFAVLQSSLADAADAGQLAAKIRSTLARPYLLEGNELHVTASVGISFYDPLVAGPDDLLAQADLALYRAKEEGRNQYRFHSAELDHEARERVAIAEELRLALDRDEFELYYQPQVEFSTGAIVGMEALIRWHHPTRGLLTPGTFLPVAEKTGAIMGIGQWVLDRACQQMNLWRKARIAPKSVAVNLSLAQLRAEQELVESVIATLDKWKVAPEELELDVTESMLAHTTLSQNDAIERLQKLGVNIAIDDFGTQYSSLDYLKTYSVSRLKIPQPMVDAAAHDPGSAAMVRAIVSIARELRIEVVAQGVETETQWSFLTEAAPTAKVQGYYYSAPVQAEQAAELLRAKRIVPAGQRSPALARKA